MNNKTRQTVVSLNENQVNIYGMVDMIDDVYSGVKTYNNKKYIKSINGTQGYEEIKQNEIYDGDYHKDLMIGLKWKQSYIMFEKGGESIDENGDLSHIYKPSDFYINWTKETIDEINSASGLRNKNRYFEEGISFSESGVYSPVFRYFLGCLFANSCPVIFLKNKEYVFYILAILVSTPIRYILKNYLNHTVYTLLEDIRDIPISNTIFEQEKLSIIISNAIEKLKNEPSADRSLFILEIDKLVYEAYGLNAEDIEEVENWYARRYPKLSQAQKANLRQLGKSDDYLQLYGKR
ncbi:MAG: BREX-1 system adenine-specific DNA-methyltransferase PglX [Pseudanabaena sp. CAN_BIN31]|nr:BREX-1 system adenine-specific DNA-methyltransferase PglX [Pseudanabaena sp. CAN_BIN31]